MRGLGLVNCRVCIEEVKESGVQRAVYDSTGENSFMLFAEGMVAIAIAIANR